MQHIPWPIQEFHQRGVRSRRGQIFGSGVCFDAPLHIPYRFFSEKSEYNSYGKHGLSTSIKVYVCSTIKILKNTPPPKFHIGGRAPGALVLDPPLIFTYIETPSGPENYFLESLSKPKQFRNKKYCLHLVFLTKLYLYRKKTCNFLSTNLIEATIHSQQN